MLKTSADFIFVTFAVSERKYSFVTLFKYVINNKGKRFQQEIKYAAQENRKLFYERNSERKLDYIRSSRQEVFCKKGVL